MKSWLIGKDSDAGRDWGQEKGTTEDEMAERHHQLDGCESEGTPGDGDRQGGLVCCDSWGRKESDTTEWLNWTELNIRDKFKKSSESNTMDLSSYHEQLWKVKVLLTQSCPTLCNPVNSSPTGSSVPGISQAGIPEWLAIPFSRESSQRSNPIQF